MIMINARSLTRAAAATFALLLTHAAGAAVSAEEAKQLGGKLTLFGAEKAGNADGSIPAYTGGLNTPPPGFDPKSGLWPNPYKGEKPLLQIDAKNMAQYLDQLTPGTQEMLKRFPSFRVDVYPSHRSMAYPQWVLDATVKNATTAKLSGAVEGDGVEGATGGIPFPIPKNGYEVIWNGVLTFKRAVEKVVGGAVLVDSTGRHISLPDAVITEYRPYYDQALVGKKWPGDAPLLLYAVVTAPPGSAGTAFLNYYPMDYGAKDQVSWVYLPGQRRTRMAPEYKYDTPMAQYSGVMFWDEQDLFRGRMDRFDMKLVGKKEIFGPYNNYDYGSTPVDQLFGAKHVNPDVIRWERQRVWVVEATLKEGARHAYSKRTFYVNEDSWNIVASDSYDQDGKLWKASFGYGINYYDGGGGVLGSPLMVNDLLKGNYFGGFTALSSGKLRQVIPADKLETPELFTPAGLTGAGVR